MRLTRITLFFIALILTVGFGNLVKYLLQDIESQTFQAMEETMVDVSHLLAEHMAQGIENESLQIAFDQIAKKEIEALIYGYTKKSIGLGCYVTDAKGRVLFHSEKPSLVGEDFSQFNDIARTLNGEYGARSSREDEGDSDSSILYVAALIGDLDQPQGVVSVFKAQSDGLMFVKRRSKQIWVSAILIGGGVALLLGAVFLWLFRPIGQLTEYARAIERGDRPNPPNVGIGREVNTLSRALLAMREALEGRKYAERYVQTLTHELKSPLSAIRGAAELLDEEMPEDKRKKFRANIKKEVKRSEELINGLLQLSAIEGRSQLEERDIVHMERLVEESLLSHSASIQQKSIHIEKNLSGDSLVEGNVSLLRSVVNNLLENAIQFSPQSGRIDLTLKCESNKIVFIVRDEGEGLPEFAKDKVFDRFYSHHAQADSKGTGLGLAFVKEAVLLHRGEVSLENNVDAGASATVYLPLTNKKA